MKVRDMLCLLLTGSVLIGSGSAAATVVVSFTGEITSVSGQAVGGPFAVDQPGGGKDPQSLVVGQFAYSAADAVDIDPSPLVGNYYNPSGILSFWVKVGDYVAAGPTAFYLSQVRVRVDHAEPRGDLVLFHATPSGDPVNGLSPHRVQFALNDFPSRSIIKARYPTVADWDDYQVLIPCTAHNSINFLVFGEPGMDRVDWKITSYSTTPTLEAIPAAPPWLLGLLGAVLFATATVVLRRQPQGQ